MEDLQPSADAEAIMLQVAKICLSQRFRDAPVLRHILRYTVEATLAGESAQLGATSIGRFALKKGVEFRSSRDSSVRVAFNRLRNALALYYSAEGQNDDIAIRFAPGCYVPSFSHARSDEDDGPATALRWADWYQGIATMAAHQRASAAVQVGLTSHPDHPELLAAYADLLLDGYKHGYEDDPRAVEHALRLIDSAKDASPDNPRVQFVDAFMALHLGDQNQVIQIGRALTEPHKSRIDRARGTWMLALVSDPSELGDQPEWGLFNQTGLPGWIHHARFVVSYAKGEYEDALHAAMRFGMRDWFWGYIDRAAALAQLGLKTAASLELQQLVLLHHHFPSNPERFLSSYVPNGCLVEHIKDGLEKAGLSKLDAH